MPLRVRAKPRLPLERLETRPSVELESELGTEEREDPNTREASSQLERALGTAVRIRRRGRANGRVEIDFHSEDELHRIYRAIVSGAREAKKSKI